MKRFLLSSFVLSLLATAALAAEEKPCTTHNKGRYYDLNPLKSSSKDHGVIGTASKTIFPVNMCRAVHTETFGVKDIEPDDIAGFMRGGHGDIVIGKVNTTLDFYDNHPRMILSSGSRCKTADNKAQDIRASTVIDFICDPSVLSSGQPRLVAALPPGKADEACAFVIEWRTQYACPSSETGILWTLFVTIAVAFLSLLLAYTVLGTLYNRFVLQLRGFDQIPQFSIESMKYHANEAIDWAKDIFSTFQSSRSSSGGEGGGFFGVPSNAPNPVSHQASVGVNIRGGNNDDLEAAPHTGDSIMGTKGFARPIPRTPMSTNRSSSGGGAGPFARAPQRPETNPVSHQTQVNAEFEHQRVQSLSQRSPLPPLSQASTSPNLSFNSSPASSSSNRAPLVSVSQSPSPPPPVVPAKPATPLPSASQPLPPAPSSTSSPLPPVPPKAQTGKAYAVGEEESDDSDEEEEESEEEQDYSEYNVDADAKELSEFKRPASGGGSGAGSGARP